MTTQTTDEPTTGDLIASDGPDTGRYATASDFSETGFWSKLRDFAGTAGRQVIEKALWLYYATKSPTCPAWAKNTALGALAYFVLPVDAVPDILPGIGFVDDLGALAAAVSIIASQITPDVKRQTEETLAKWFPKKA